MGRAGIPNWSKAGIAVGGIIVVAVVASVGIGVGSPLTLRGVWCAALVAAALVFVWERERRRALVRLTGRARGMLNTDLAGAAREEASSDGLPAELRPLAEAVAEVSTRMREQLREAAKSGRNLGALIDAMDEPLLATDNEDRVILWSRSAEAMLEVRGEAMRGRPIRELFTSDEVLRMHGEARSGRAVRGRVRVVTPVGARVYQVAASPVPAAWGEGVFGAVLTLRDVTELDQAVQVKTDFVANASHELRTPVAAIRSAAETLEAAQDDSAMSARLRGMILSHAARLEEMLRDLLDLSRLESPEARVRIEPVSLLDVEAMLRAQHEEVCRERRLTLAFDLDAELAGLRTDRRLLMLMLRNLVENATKFAHEGTRIDVIGHVIEQRTDAGPSAQGDSVGALHGVVRFEVRDRGVGVPLAQQERVFERYYQVDAARTGTGGAPGAPGQKRGTGLGLAIVKHAARTLGGRVGLTSVWGEGTTVWVEVPCGLGEEDDGKVRM